MQSCSAVRLPRAQLQSLPILPFLAPRVFAPWPSHLITRSAFDQEPRRRASTQTCLYARRRPQCLYERHRETECRQRQRAGQMLIKRHVSTTVAPTDTPKRQTTAKKSQPVYRSIDFRYDNGTGPDIFEEVEEASLRSVDDLARRQERADDAAKQWYLEMAPDGDGDTLQLAWAALPLEMKTFRWARLASWLSTQPANDAVACRFIATSLDNTNLPSDAIYNVLQAATLSIDMGLDQNALQNLASHVFSAVKHTLNQDEQAVIPNSTLRFVAWYCADDLVKPLHEFLVQKKVDLDDSLLLRLAYRFVPLHDLLALKLLEQTNLPKTALKHESVIKLCSLIIEDNHSRNAETKTRIWVVNHIREMGVPLETRLINSLIKNALVSSRIDLAMHFYSQLKIGGSPAPNDDTYMLLLPKLHNAEHQQVFEQLQDDLKLIGVQNISSKLAQELAIARSKHVSQFFGTHHFESALSLYEAQFSLQPLKQLGMVAHDYRAQRSEFTEIFCGPLPLPTADMVDHMIRIYMQSLVKIVLPMLDLWRHLLEMRNKGDELFLQLAQKLSVWSYILKMICNRKSTRRFWPQLIQDMESVPLNSKGRPYRDVQSGEIWTPPVADRAVTWNIIINGYAQSRMMREAELVVKLMSLRGIDPNLSTFITLLSGYALMQDIRGIEQVLRRIELSGLSFKVTGHTLKALSEFKNKDALAKVLDESRRRRSDPYTARPSHELFESSDDLVTDEGLSHEFLQWYEYDVNRLAEAESSRSTRTAARRAGPADKVDSAATAAPSSSSNQKHGILPDESIFAYVDSLVDAGAVAGRAAV